MRNPDPNAPAWVAVAREFAGDGTTPAGILRRVRDREPGSLSGGLIVTGLVMGFGVPIRTAMDTVRWQGLGAGHSMTDDELNELLAPYF
ncbi:hypothetical protein KOI35_23745 [Actinoplanes bogorensis]|uniref:Uncharacterized protein n=1 Tax=Paractinoplanes bogorensis TaxID=1610840 RepID=A0ABS5YWP5_9ACTN|nr:hypothetical protein [Actinoplanes bogorensis]MBU2666525.1 hypothetical protein [Actinoplanes bogorensis]